MASAVAIYREGWASVPRILSVWETMRRVSHSRVGRDGVWRFKEGKWR
jgi:hypothetical protein